MKFIKTWRSNPEQISSKSPIIVLLRTSQSSYPIRTRHVPVFIRALSSPIPNARPRRARSRRRLSLNERFATILLYRFRVLRWYELTHASVRRILRDAGVGWTTWQPSWTPVDLAFALSLSLFLSLTLIPSSLSSRSFRGDDRSNST